MTSASLATLTWRTAESEHVRPNHRWSAFGLRDPSLLTDADGHPWRDAGGNLTLYFNARDRAYEQGGTTVVGRAVGDTTHGWHLDDMPAFTDGIYAAQGSVLRVAADDWRLYYSRDTRSGLYLARSSDGMHWQPVAAPLLVPSQVGAQRTGLPFVRRIGERWVMLFEATRDARFGLYMALSSDGLHFTPAHGGEPLYRPAAHRWDSYAQANPSLVVDAEGYHILYNGCASLSAWDIGLLSAPSLDGPWQSMPSPLLRRGDTPRWAQGRIEGARLIPGTPPALLYFGLPTDDSYAGGTIALARPVDSTAEAAQNDKLAQQYFSIWDRFPIQRFTHRNESRLLARSIADGASVLVLGSGGGRELPALLAKGCPITCVDLSAAMLDAGRARYPQAPITWLQADMQDLPTGLQDFDAALCLGAGFNYLPAPEQAVACIARAVKPGGQLFLAVLNESHASEPEGSRIMADGRVRMLYTPQHLRRLLAAFGPAQVRGMRYLVDRLPPQWNRDPARHPWGRRLLAAALALEPFFAFLFPAARAKFLWVHAHRKAAA